MAIANHDTGERLVDAIPLLPGEYPAANLLAQHEYLNIGSAVLLSSANDNSMPTFNSLGKDHFVLWTDNLA